MWSRIIGNKNNDFEDDRSHSSRRSAEDGHSSRRAPEFSTSSKPTRKQSRDEIRDRGFNPTSTSYSSTTRSPYPGTASASIASSYATAGSNQIDNSPLPPSVVRNTSLAENMPIVKPAREEEDQKYGRDRKSERRRERSSSRDRKHGVESGDRRERKMEKRDERDRRRGGRENDMRPRRSQAGFSDDYGQNGEMSRGIFDDQIGGPGFTQFPGQYDGIVPGSSNGLSYPTYMSDHVPDQFPGQFPIQSSAPYRPPTSSSQGGPGLASEYYNDHGESVSQQPGVRPQPPALIVGAEPHLQAAAPIAAPPPEPSSTGGVGAAASFYSGIDDLPSASSIKPPSSSIPAKETGSSRINSSITYSSSVAAMGSAALGYATGAAGQTNRPQSSVNGRTSYQQMPAVVFPDAHQSSSVPIQNNSHSASAPILPTLGGVAAGAAASYILGEHTSSYQQSSNKIQPTAGRPSVDVAPSYGRPPSYSGAYQESMTAHGQSTKPGKPPLESSNNSVYVAGAASAAGLAATSHHHNKHSSGYLSSTGNQDPSTHTAQRHRHRHHGPLSKFVDFWKDPAGVAQFEEYTEYIGVCKYCFAPGSSPRDAPRKHYYRKRRSNERLGSSTRVDKDSRYWSSDSESRRRKKSSWLATGLAGYGLAKVGESLVDQKDGFEESYIVSSGHAKQSREQNRSSDRRSSVSYGVTRRSSDARIRDRIETSITSDGKTYRKDSRGSSTGGPTIAMYDSRRPIKSAPRSRSRSRDRKTRLAEGVLGKALGTSVASSSTKYRQESPEKTYSKSTHRIRARSPKRDGRSHYSPSSSYVNLKSSHGEEPGFFGGFFSLSGDKTSKNGRKSKKDKGIFTFSNASSSSSDSRPAFRGKYDRQKDSKKPKNQDNDQRKAEAAILGIGAVAATIAANGSRKNHKPRAKTDLVAVKETKARHARQPQEHRTKQAETSSGLSEDQWESATDNDYHSADSALAYGLSRRKSRDSLNSESSGTNKWGWRWGSKKKKRNIVKSPNGNDKPIIAGIGTAALAATAIDTPFANDIDCYENNMDSVIGGTLRNVYPIATSDPTRYDADNHSSVVFSKFPIMASRPAPIPLQQPQPIVPISDTVYSSQPIYGHSYSAPSGHPAFTQGFSHSQAPANERYGGIIKDVNVPGSFHTKERSTGSNIRDFPNDQKLPRQSAPSKPTNGDDPRRVSYREEPASIRFDLAKEREDQDRRQRRRERKDEEDRLERLELREAVQQAEMEKAERVLPDRPNQNIDKTEDLDTKFMPQRPDEKKSPRESQTSWVAPVAAAIAAATVGATISGVEPTRRDHQSIKMQNDSSREYKRALKQNHEECDEISAEDFSAATIQAKLIRQAAAKVRKPPSPVHESYAAYFVPPDLPSKAKEKAQFEQPFVDDVKSSYPVAEIVTIEPRSRYPNPPDFDYAEDKDLVVFVDPKYTPVPDLHLINPTPLHSYAGSLRSDASPVIQPKDGYVAEEKQPVRPRTGSKVTWADDQTREYTDITPLEQQEEFVDEDKTAAHRNEDEAQSVEEVGDHRQNQSAEPNTIKTSHIPGEFGDDLEFAATLAAGLEDTGFNPSIVVDDPTFRRRESPPGSERATFYITPFAETVTDLGLDSPDTEGAHPQQGILEGELPPTPEVEVEHPMPGTFDEDPKASVDQNRIDGMNEAAKLENERKEPTKIDRVVSRTEDFPGELEEWATSGKKRKSKSKKGSKRDDKDIVASPSMSAGGGDISFKLPVELAASQESYGSQDNRNIENVMAKALEMKGLGDDSRTFGQRSALDADNISNNPEPGMAYGSSQPPPEDGERTKSYDLLQEDDGDRKKPRKESKDENNILDDVALATVAAAMESRKGSKSKSKKDKKGDLRGMSSKSMENISELGHSEDSTKKARFEDFEEPKRKSKKFKDRKSTRDEEEGSNLVSQTGNDPLKIDEQDEAYVDSRKLKDKKKRQRVNSGLQDETGRSTHDLPAKDHKVTQIEVGVGEGSEDLVDRDAPRLTNSNESVSFLGERREILKPPDERTPAESSNNPAEHARITSADTIYELASTDQDHAASQGLHVSPVGIVDAEDLPHLLASKPESPTPQRGVTYSPTAIPFHFRKLPASPSFARTSSTGFPVSSSPTSGAFNIRPKSRPTSTEFKSNEFRPLWLVERHSWREKPLPGEYPSLPSSHTTSRSSSVHDADVTQAYDETENDAVYLEGNSAPGEVTEMSLNTSYTNVSPDLLDSQQTTPIAASFHSLPEADHTIQIQSLLPAGVFDQGLLAEQERPRSSTPSQVSKIKKQSNVAYGDDGIEQNADSLREGNKRHDDTGALSIAESGPPPTVNEEDYSNSTPTIGGGAFGAAIRPAGVIFSGSQDSGNHAMEPTERVPVPEAEHELTHAEGASVSTRQALQRVISSLDPFDGSDIAASDKAGITDEEVEISTQRTASALSRAGSGPLTMSAEEKRQIEEKDAQDAVESWFASTSPKKVKKDKKGKKKARSLDVTDTTQASPSGVGMISVPDPQQVPQAESLEEHPQNPQDFLEYRPDDIALGEPTSLHSIRFGTASSDCMSQGTPPVQATQLEAILPEEVKVIALTQETRPSVSFEDDRSSLKSFSNKTKKPKAKKGRKKSTINWDENVGGSTMAETVIVDDGTDPATSNESIQALQQTTKTDVAYPVAANSEQGLGEDALLADTQAQEAYIRPSKSSKKKNKQSLTRPESYDHPYENHSIHDKASNNKDLASQVAPLEEGVGIDSSGPAEGGLIGSMISAATLPLLLSTTADNQTSDEQQSNLVDGSGLVDALNLSAGSNGQQFRGAPLGEEDLAVDQSFAQDNDDKQVTNDQKKGVMSPILEQPPKPDLPALTTHDTAGEFKDLSIAFPSLSGDVQVQEQPEIQHATTPTDSDSNDSSALTHPMCLPEDYPLPAGDDLDLLDALPESPIICPDFSGPGIEGQMKHGAIGKDDACESRETLLNTVSSPKQTSLSTSDDLDLLDAYPGSPTTLPQKTPLPTGDDLDLLDSLSESPMTLPDSSELPTQENSDTKSIARDDDGVNLLKLGVSPKQRPLLTSDDLGSLAALPESPTVLPNYSELHIMEGFDTGSVTRDDAPSGREHTGKIVSPKKTPLPTSDKPDLLNALPKSPILLPDYANPPTNKGLDTRSIGEDQYLEDREVSVDLLPFPEQMPLPDSDDLDLLDALPESPIILPEYSTVPARIESETVEDAEIKDIHLPAAFPVSPKGLPLRTEDGLGLPDPLPESPLTRPNHSNLQSDDTHHVVKAGKSSDQDNLMTVADHVILPGQTPLPVGDDSDLYNPVTEVPIMQPNYLEPNPVNQLTEASRDSSIDPHNSQKVLPLGSNVEILPSLTPIDPSESKSQSIAQLAITPPQEPQDLPTKQHGPDETYTPVLATDETGNVTLAADAADEFLAITPQRKKKNKKSRRSQPATPITQEDAEGMREMVSPATVNHTTLQESSTKMPVVNKVNGQTQEEEWALSSNKNDKKDKKQKSTNMPAQSFETERGSMPDVAAVPASEDPSTTGGSRTETPIQPGSVDTWAPPAKRKGRKGKKQSIKLFQTESISSSLGEELDSAPSSAKGSLPAAIDDKQDTFDTPMDTPTEQPAEDLWATPAKKKGKKGKQQRLTTRELLETPEPHVEPANEREDLQEVSEPTTLEPTKIEPLPKGLLKSGMYEQLRGTSKPGSPKSVSDVLQDPESSLSTAVTGPLESFGEQSHHEPVAVTDIAQESSDLLAGSTDHESSPRADAETADPELLFKLDNLELAPGESSEGYSKSVLSKSIGQERDNAEQFEAWAAPKDNREISSGTSQAATDTVKDLEGILLHPDYNASPNQTPQVTPITIRSLPATEELTQANSKVPIEQTPSEASQAPGLIPRETLRSGSHTVRDFELSDVDLPSWSMAKEVDVQAGPQVSEYKVPTSALTPVSRAHNFDQLLDAAQISLPEDGTDDFPEAMSGMQAESLKVEDVPEFFRSENGKEIKIPVDTDINPAQLKGSSTKDIFHGSSPITGRSPEIIALSENVGSHNNRDALEVGRSINLHMIADPVAAPDETFSISDLQMSESVVHEPLKSLKERQITPSSSEEALMPTSSMTEKVKENAIEAEATVWEDEAPLVIPKSNAGDGSREVQLDNIHKPLILSFLPPAVGHVPVLSRKDEENAEEALTSTWLDQPERSLPSLEAVESATAPVLRGPMPAADAAHMEHKSGAQDNVMSNTIDEYDTWSETIQEPSEKQDINALNVLGDVREEDPATTGLSERPDNAITPEYNAGGSDVKFSDHSKEKKEVKIYELSVSPEEPISIANTLTSTDPVSAEKHSHDLQIPVEDVDAIPAKIKDQISDEPGISFSLKKSKEKKKAKKAYDVEWIEDSPKVQALKPSAESSARESVTIGEESSLGSTVVDPVRPEVVLMPEAEAVDLTLGLKKSKKDKKKAQKAQTLKRPEESSYNQELTPSAVSAAQESFTPTKDPSQKPAKSDDDQSLQVKRAEPESDPIDSSFSLKKSKKDKKKGKKVPASDWPEDSPSLQDPMQSAKVGVKGPTMLSDEASRALPDLDASKTLLETVLLGAEADPMDSVFSLKKSKKDKKKGKRSQASDWSEAAPSAQSPIILDGVAANGPVAINDEPSGESTDIHEHKQISQDKRAESMPDLAEPSFTLNKSKKDKKKGKKAETYIWPQDDPSQSDPFLSTVDATQEPVVFNEISKDPANANDLVLASQTATKNLEIDPVGTSLSVKEDKKTTKMDQPLDWAGADSREESSNIPTEHTYNEHIAISSEHAEGQAASTSHDLVSGLYDTSSATGIETQAPPSIAPVPMKNVFSTDEWREPDPTSSTEDTENGKTPKGFAASDRKNPELVIGRMPIASSTVSSVESLPAISDHSRNAAHEPSPVIDQPAAVQKDDMTLEVHMMHKEKSPITGTEELEQSTVDDHGWEVPGGKSQMSKKQRKDVLDSTETFTTGAGHPVLQDSEFHSVDHPPVAQEKTVTERSASINAKDQAAVPKGPHGTEPPIQHYYPSVENVVRDTMVSTTQEHATRLVTQESNSVQADDSSSSQEPTYYYEGVRHSAVRPEVLARTLDDPSRAESQPPTPWDENALNKAQEIAITPYIDHTDSVPGMVVEEPNDWPASRFPESDASFEDTLQSVYREPITTEQEPAAPQVIDNNTVAKAAEPMSTPIASADYMGFPITRKSKKGRKGKKQQDPVIWEDETATPPMRNEASMAEGEATRAPVAQAFVDPTAGLTPEADDNFARQDSQSYASNLRSISPSLRVNEYDELREDDTEEGNSWRFPSQAGGHPERTRPTALLPSLPQRSVLGEEHQEELFQPTSSYNDQTQDYFSFDPEPLAQQDTLEEIELEALRHADAIESIELDPLVPVSMVTAENDTQELVAQASYGADTPTSSMDISAHGAGTGDGNNKTLEQQIERPNNNVLPATQYEDRTLETQPEHEKDSQSTKKSKKQKLDYEDPDSISNSGQLSKSEEVSSQGLLMAPRFGSDAVSQEYQISTTRDDNPMRVIVGEVCDGGRWKTNDIVVAATVAGLGAGDLVEKKSEKGVKKDKKGKKNNTEGLWTNFEGQDTPEPMVQEEPVEMPQKGMNDKIMGGQTNTVPWEEDQHSSHQSQEATTEDEKQTQDLDLDRTAHPKQNITEEIGLTFEAQRGDFYTGNTSPGKYVTYHPAPANDEGDINRDSALHISDSPVIADIPSAYHAIRDSGYQDTESSPLVGHEYKFAAAKDQHDNRVLQESIPEESQVAEAVHYGEFPNQSPMYDERKDTFNVSVEADSDYDISLSRPMTKRGRSRIASQKTQDHQDEYHLPKHNIEPQHNDHLLASTGDDLRQPSPVDSTTRHRSSVLFQSSPSTREDSARQGAAHAAVVPDEEAGPDDPRQIHERSPSQDAPTPNDPSVLADRAATLAALSGADIPAKHEHHSLFGGPAGINSNVVSPPRTPLSPDSSSRRLKAIPEYSPEESPLHKHSRAMSDVGSPDRSHKSARRTATPQALAHSRVRSPLAAASVQRKKSLISTDDIISSLDWPAVDDEKHSVDLDRSRSISRNTNPHRALSRQSNLSPLTADPTKHRGTEQRSVSGASIASIESINAIIRTPDQIRSVSGLSHGSSGTPPLRRVDRSVSSDLRAANKQSEAKRQAKPKLADPADPETVIPSSSTYDPVTDKGKTRARDMVDVYEGYGDVHGSPLSPTRPPSVRRMQSMQMLQLEQRLDSLVSENRLLHDAKSRAERSLEDIDHERSQERSAYTEAIQTRDVYVQQKNAELSELKQILEGLHGEVSRLTEINEGFVASRGGIEEYEQRYSQLEAEHASTHQQWQRSQRELEDLREQHKNLSGGMEEIVRHEIAVALEGKNTELRKLREELEAAKEQVRVLQKQILASKPSDEFLINRDEDYFENRCQQLCHGVQQWILRFSKFSDMKPCLLSSDIADEKITDRFENAILDGSDVDTYLADRVKRRDVFMSVAMTMIFEYIFTRYLFGMDREQRQKLKSLEKTLSEVGPMSAVHKWRATTLTLLSKRESFLHQRAEDTEAVVHEVYNTLATFLPPPPHLVSQVQDSLRNVMRLAVDLSIEMRTQRAEYIMLPPLQPEYDINGDLARKVYFNASLMNERSGNTESNEELQEKKAVVRMVLFPLVVKKDETEEEVVICPAQVLCKGKGKRVGWEKGSAIGSVGGQVGDE